MSAPSAPEPVRILVTAARDWTDPFPIRAALDIALAEYGSIVVAHGACPEGGDQIAATWVAERRSPAVAEDALPAGWDWCTPRCQPGHRVTKADGDTVHPGTYPDYCPDAGPRRNAELVRRGAARCLAFLTPRSRGAAGTADLAEAAGIPTRRLSAVRGGGTPGA